MDLTNPNEPGLPSLETEDGIKQAALGVYSKFGLEYFWLGLGYHSAMGDELWISAGNYSWRWANQATKITLSDGTVLTPPQGVDQPTELRNRNQRVFGNDNAFYNEWSALYLVNNQANLLIDAVENPALKFTGNAATKKATIKAWAHWWKGFAYSRLGSLYIAGVITDELNTTNSNFVTNQALLAEAAKQFDLASAELDKATEQASYEEIMTAIVPSFTQVENGTIPTKEMWKRHMSTYKARNILVNKKLSAMTAQDWNSILTLTATGLQKGDKYFTMRSAEVDDLVSGTAWAPWRLLSFGWDFLSERLVQDFKPGDARRTRNVTTVPTGTVVNRSNRGFLYGTRYQLIDIVDGGDYASAEYGEAEIPMGATYEENALMRAEALIKTGKIEDGLKLIDEVRTHQKANLPAVAGTGLTEAQAYEELRRERRIGLFLKNVVFYDARRWNVSSKDGGRTGAVVIKTGGVADTNATIYYNYLDYWDVPNNEIDFNSPGSGSAPVVSPQ